MTRHKQFIFFALSFLFLIASLWSTLKLNLYNNDAYVFMPSKDLSTGWEYWKYIFSHNNGFGVQYRPLGFFGYFYFAKILFGTNPLFYRIFGICLLIFSSLLFFKIETHLIKSFYAKSIGFLFFLFHGMITFPILDISSIAKYYVPLCILLSGILLIMRNNSTSDNLKVNFTLFTLSLFSLFFHEGSITFPLIFLLFKYLYKRPLSLADSLLTLPIIGFLLVKTLYLGMPTQGNFMHIGVERFIQNFSHLSFLSISSIVLELTSILNPIIWIILTALTLSLLLALSVRSIKKIDNLKIISTLLLSLALTISPFSLLTNHYHMDILQKGVIWSIPFAALFWALLFEFSLNNKQRRIVIAIVTFFLSISLFIGNHNIKKRQISVYNYLQGKMTTLLTLANEHIQSNPLAQEETIQLKFSGNDFKSRYMQHFYASVIPGILSVHLSNYHFLLSVDGSNPSLNYSQLNTLVRENVYFRINSMDAEINSARDIYGYKRTIKITRPLSKKIYRVYF